MSENLTDPHHNVSHHTWVDDVTVSSDEQLPNGQETCDPGTPGFADDCGQLKRRKKLKVCAGEVTDIDPNHTGGGEEMNDGTEDKVMDLWDLKEQQECLPGYVCPNSIDKSKELAVQSWLQKTDFPHSCRELPLY